MNIDRENQNMNKNISMSVTRRRPNFPASSWNMRMGVKTSKTERDNDMYRLPIEKKTGITNDRKTIWNIKGNGRS